MTIYQIQCLLAYLGFYKPPLIPDGKFGPGTKAAVARFQAAYGIGKDGIPGNQTQKALKDAVAHGMPIVDDKDEGTAYPPSSDWPFKHFARAEFACKCGCGFDSISPKLVAVAEDIREKHGTILVSSGCRCKTHNAAVGGVRNSRHTIGHAMDFCIVGKSASQALAIAKSYKEIVYAYAINDDYVHMDIGR